MTRHPRTLLPAVTMLLGAALAGACGPGLRSPSGDDSGSSSPTTTADGSATATSATGDNASAPTGERPATGPGAPVSLVYAVHVHAEQDYRPYRSWAMLDLDEERFAGMLAHIRAIADVLEEHGGRASFHFVSGTATALCREAPELVEELLAAGHEIGAHSHGELGLAPAYEALTDEQPDGCGLPIEVASGIVAIAGGGKNGPGLTAESVSRALEAVQATGATVVLGNLGTECARLTGEPLPPTGNRPQPWVPNHTAGDPCGDAPTGPLTIVDHVSISAIVQGGPPDPISARQFDALASRLRAALDAPDAVGPTVWGFVTHTTEYVEGDSFLDPPAASALGALDRFLAERVDPAVAAGRAVWSTAAEIAAEFAATARGRGA